MSPNNLERRSAADVTAMLLPLMAVVLIAFLVVGVALPILPVHVHQGLGLGAFVVGLITGSQFVASLLSRVWAGHYSDTRGSKRGVVVGLLAAAASGLLYLVSVRFIQFPIKSAAILLLGRALLGVGESFIITGAVSWALGRTDARNSGKVIAWVGMAMFAGLAFGAPIGTYIYEVGGFAAVAVTTALVPILVLVPVIGLPSVTPTLHTTRPGLFRVAKAVWMPGVGAAFSSIGFGAILAFGSLLFVERGWKPIWLVFTAYAISLITTRVFIGHLPDRIGGAKVALVSIWVEASGLLLMFLAPTPAVAAVGAALTGFGYSLVYPGLGAEAVRRVSPQSRGLVMGLYTAFLDVALGFGTPALGLIASWGSLNSVFITSAAIVLCATTFVVPLMSSPDVNEQ